MSLRITVVPATTQGGRETVRALLADKSQPTVRGVYRNPSKAPLEFVNNPRFEAVEGDVFKNSGLDFSDSDAVQYIPPPTYEGTDSAEFATTAANNIKAALEKAPSVKRLFVFSAMGAQHDKDIGILKINHITDEMLKTSASEVVIVRPGYFMENWAGVFDTVYTDAPYFESSLTPLDHKVTMISTGDIGVICAQKLLETGKALPSNPQVFGLHGPRNYSPNDIKEALETVTKKQIKVVPIERDQLLDYYSNVVPAPYAKELMEMTTATLPGGILVGEMDRTEGIIRGNTELVDFLQQIAAARQ